MLLEDDERVYAFTRRLGDDELLVLGNFSGEDAPVELEDAGGELVLGNYDDAGERASAAAVGGAGAAAPRDDRHAARAGAGAHPRGRRASRGRR